MKAVRSVTSQHTPGLYSLREQIAKCSRSVKPRHYISQPMPKSYSKTVVTSFDHVVPSQMQDAFARSIQ